MFAISNDRWIKFIKPLIVLLIRLKNFDFSILYLNRLRNVPDREVFVGGLTKTAADPFVANQQTASFLYFQYYLGSYFKRFK